MVKVVLGLYKSVITCRTGRAGGKLEQHRDVFTNRPTTLPPSLFHFVPLLRANSEA